MKVDERIRGFKDPKDRLGITDISSMLTLTQRRPTLLNVVLVLPIAILFIALSTSHWVYELYARHRSFSETRVNIKKRTLYLS